MKKRFPILLIVFIAILAPLGAWMYSAFSHGAEYPVRPWEKPATLEAVVDDVLQDRAKTIEKGGDISFGSDAEINVLVLGLDARKGWKEPHCDAIHMFTLNVEDWSMKITSVPRGTYAYIPPGTYEETEYYLANACSYAGLDYGISQIERVVGVKADYYVTVGFSQTLGILRQLGLPTTESLQWLRHRQSFSIGDPQRSRNQAQFMKDLVTSQAEKLRGTFSAPMQYILYSMVDTNMEYGTMRALMEGFLEAEIDQRADDIVLDMRPYHSTQEMHLDFENPNPQIEALLSSLKGRLSEEDLSGKSLDTIQQDLIDYLEEELESSASVVSVIEKQLWLQVEDTQIREEMHFAFTERYTKELENKGDTEGVVDLLGAYILEKQTLGYENFANKGRELMAEYVRVEL